MTNGMRTRWNSISGSSSLISYQHTTLLYWTRIICFVFVQTPPLLSGWIQSGGEKSELLSILHRIDFNPGNRLKGCYLNSSLTQFQDDPAKCFIKHASRGDPSTTPWRALALFQPRAAHGAHSSARRKHLGSQQEPHAGLLRDAATQKVPGFLQRSLRLVDTDNKLSSPTSFLWQLN